MRILIVGHSLVVDSNRGLFTELAKRGHVVDIVAPSTWSSSLQNHFGFQYNIKFDENFEDIYTINSYFTGNASIFFFKFLSLYKVLTSKRYDFIFIWQESWSLVLFQFVLLKFFSVNHSTKTFITAAQNIKKYKLKWLQLLERFTTKFVHTILYCSEEVKEVVLWKKLSARSLYFPLSYDASLFNKKKVYSNGTVVIGYIGRLSPEKGLDTLIEAFKKLRADGVDVRLRIAGAGPLVSMFENEVGIDYLGVVPHNEAHLFYQDIDIFVLPSKTTMSWKEQFGRVLIEAAASGNLVLGSSSGSIPEVMKKIESPYIFQEDSSTDLLRNLYIAIGDLKNGRAFNITETCSRNCVQSFSHSSVALLLEDYIKSI
jgi:glycosyltransferase involved in cell wall biosynthesis